MNISNNFNDILLVEKSLKNPDFFAEIIDRYESSLRRYVCRISSFSEEIVEELLQEIFVKAWQNLNSFNASQKFSSWIYRIAHNHVVSAFRKHSSRGEDKAVQWNDDFDFAEETDLVKSLDSKISGEICKDVLEKLKPTSREVLVLFFWEQKSYDEISDILKKPKSTIGTLISRAKKEFHGFASAINLNSKSL